MRKLNPYVIAQLDLMRARASEGLAKLEAAERGSTSIGGSGAGQITRQRQIKERRDQVETLKWLLAVAQHEDQAIPFTSDSAAPPDRIVAQVDRSTGAVFCNKRSCYFGRNLGTLAPRTAEDLTEDVVCWTCTTDVRV